MSSQGRSSSKKSQQQFDDGDLMLEERPARSSMRRALSALRSMMAAHAVLTIIVGVMVVAAFVMAVSALVRVKNTTELAETTQEGLPGALLRIDALEQTDTWLINQTNEIFDDLEALEACCDNNTARIGIVESIVNNFLSLFTTQTLVVTGNTTVGGRLTAVNVTVSNTLTTLNASVTDTLTTRRLVVTEQSLPAIANIGARVVVTSCTDMSNETGTRSQAFFNNLFNTIASIMPPATGAGSRPAQFILGGDNAYGDNFATTWYANWIAANPTIDVAQIGSYSQTLGYWTYPSNTSENVNGWIRYRDSLLFKYSLFSNMTALTAAVTGLNTTGRVMAIYDDHDSGPNDAGGAVGGLAGGFKYALQTKQALGNAFGDSWWAFKRNDATHGAYGKRTLTMANGQTVDLIVLDDQFHLEVQELLDANGRAWDNPANQLLGGVQLRWLEDTLRTSAAAYRIIYSGTPMYYGRYFANHHASDVFFVTHLIDKLALERTMFVGGDFHFFATFEDTHIAGSTVLSVVASGSGWTNSVPVIDPLLPEMKFINFASSTINMFTVIDILGLDTDPKIVISHCRIVDNVGLTVVNRYEVPARVLTHRQPAPLLVPATPPQYLAYFSLELYDARFPLVSSMITTPPTLTLYDQTPLST